MDATDVGDEQQTGDATIDTTDEEEMGPESSGRPSTIDFAAAAGVGASERYRVRFTFGMPLPPGQAASESYRVGSSPTVGNSD